MKHPPFVFPTSFSNNSFHLLWYPAVSFFHLHSASPFTVSSLPQETSLTALLKCCAFTSATWNLPLFPFSSTAAKSTPFSRRTEQMVGRSCWAAKWRAVWRCLVSSFTWAPASSCQDARRNMVKDGFRAVLVYFCEWSTQLYRDTSRPPECIKWYQYWAATTCVADQMCRKGKERLSWSTPNMLTIRLLWQLS